MRCLYLKSRKSEACGVQSYSHVSLSVSDPPLKKTRIVIVTFGLSGTTSNMTRAPRTDASGRAEVISTRPLDAVITGSTSIDFQSSSGSSPPVKSSTKR